VIERARVRTAVVVAAILLGTALAGCAAFAGSDASAKLLPLQPGAWPTTTRVPPSPTASPFPQVYWAPTPLPAALAATTSDPAQDATAVAKLAPLATAAPASSGLPGEIGPGSANVRQGPGTGYAVTAVLYKGDKVTVVAANPAQDWLQVQAGGKEGWVSRALVTVSGNLGALPQAAPGTPAG